MNWIKTLTAVVATLGLGSVAQAGLFDSGCCGTAKSCGCASTCQPSCCKPVITRPCSPRVHTYQRACSTLTAPSCKPSCCGWDSSGCCKKSCAAPSGNACGANACAPNCAAPAANAGANACGKTGCAPPCAAPCGPKACCVPGAMGPNCAAPCGPKACCAPGAMGSNCAARSGNACGANAGCGNNATSCGNNAAGGGDRYADECCVIAHLIYQSQTVCYAKDRKKALDKLGDKFSCVCHPEIMSAFVHGLNDCDERVRWEAADELGDQLRKNPCCCSAELTQALTAALADCDKGVRRQAEEALRACGYEIVDGCCDSCGSTGSGAAGSGSCGAVPAAAPAPAPAETKDAAPAPAPAPPEEPKAFFPSPLQKQQTMTKSKLANLFGLRS